MQLLERVLKLSNRSMAHTTCKLLWVKQLQSELGMNVSLHLEHNKVDCHPICEKIAVKEIFFFTSYTRSKVQQNR